MSDDVQNTTPGAGPNTPVPFARPRRRWRRSLSGDGRPTKPRVHRLRLLLILLGLCTLALISTLFGMMMAVASDLPQLEMKARYKFAKASILYDDRWRPIGVFAPPNHVVLVGYSQIGQAMKDAIVAIEDKRFWSNSGIDVRGIGRAFLSDVTGGGPRQGASTIAQQFVKNALTQQNNRTVFEKLREAALAYHLTRKWQKAKILTEYLNSIYFGNGAYGVESAARVYFGTRHGFDPTQQSDTSVGGCGDSAPNAPRPACAYVLAPDEAALLAGMVASPTAYDPIAHPVAARKRRDLVLRAMLDQGKITRQQYDQATSQPLPTKIQQPLEPTAAPYFTSWLRPQIVAAMGAYRAYYGDLQIKTSLDLDMQHAAEQAIQNDLPSSPGVPTASLVAIDNRTGEVRAMVGGPLVNGQEDYTHSPFNLATEGHRQPGSSFKPFTLATALESGITPDSVWTSAPQDFIVPYSGGKEHFIVHNFGNTYSGSITLTGATTVSDNSVYSQVGIRGIPNGPTRIAALAKRMGIRSPVSNNYAMILGGLTTGVSPLDMAHAYETFATGGNKVVNPRLGAPNGGPVGIDQINCPVQVCQQHVLVNTPALERILPPTIAQTVHDILTTVVQSGTGTQAAISGVDVAGKTGTTSNYGDAWFVGWTPQITTAVWVGFPNKLVSMATDYNGGPVEGGTYPAIIWHDFVTQALQILANQAPGNTQNGQTNSTTTGTTSASGGAPGAQGVAGASSSTPAPATGAGAPAGNAGATGGGSNGAGAAGGATGGRAGGGGATGGGGGGATGGGGGAGGGGTGAAGGGTAGGTGGGTGGAGLGR